MEELGFFNEREAECFEREDTLSQSDLEKLNVDENMPEMDRVEKLLKTGLDRQKISILNSLPKILASNNTKTNLALVLDCMKGVWQKFESEMNADPAVLLEIFKALANLACTTVDGKVLSYPTVTFHEEYAEQLDVCREEKKNAVFLLTDDQITKLFVPFVLDIIAEIQHKDYAEDASLALIAMLPRIGIALKKTQMMALCQDTDAEVRRCMCVQLDGLARAVGEQLACTELLPELLELLQDEEEQVKQTAFLALLSLVDFFPARDRVKLIIPEFISIAESPPDYLVHSLAEQSGNLVTKLATLSHLGNDTGPVFLQSYGRLCAQDDAEIRQRCAYNFPAIVKAFGSTFSSTLMDDILAKLASDPSEEVRHYIAAGIHEVATLLGQQRALRYLKGVVLNLVNDESPNVQGMAISRVPQLLSVMINSNDEEQKFLDEATIDSDRDVANALHEARQGVDSNSVGHHRRPQDDVDDKRKLAEEENLGLMTDHEDSSSDSKWSSMLEYTLVVGKDGQVVRRARVKSFDLVNKIIRIPGKDTGRTSGMNVGGGGLGMGSNESNSMALGMPIKFDSSKSKSAASRTQNKLGPTLTTLPNCATARPGLTKMPQTSKVANSTGKFVASGSKSAGGPTRAGTSLPKDVGTITKIPIIRPSAPAKREVSPPTITKPGSATLTLGSGSSRLGTIDNSGAGILKPPKPGGAPMTPKR
ncbi:Serine/threonine-protein phosphatase 4 regulatory subunit 4 [Phytophthora boehmeriae]|uniref:Serine/threonine-protein phosphatase 4 regulatory subunit 4 n=1 Tax=Phytophthora boehmeriae TaxID=109152 RepID=A0A8T1WS74_9STRA|nr:Serine/threonine-protein phosphatase 4 regulatory subunit 4 [Phytophthora boehmeriae]